LGHLSWPTCSLPTPRSITRVFADGGKHFYGFVSPWRRLHYAYAEGQYHISVCVRYIVWRWNGSRWHYDNATMIMHFSRGRLIIKIVWYGNLMVRFSTLSLHHLFRSHSDTLYEPIGSLWLWPSLQKLWQWWVGFSSKCPSEHNCPV
jgi:hypothetical protein